MYAPRGRHVFPRLLHCLICNEKYRFEDLYRLAIDLTDKVVRYLFLKHHCRHSSSVKWDSRFFLFFFWHRLLSSRSSTMLWKHNKCFPKRRTRKLKGSQNSKFIWNLRWIPLLIAGNSDVKRKIHLNDKHLILTLSKFDV